MIATAPAAIRTARDADYGWTWSRFWGDKEALRYAKRELVNVEGVLAHVPGRTRVIQAGGSLGIFPKFLAQQFAQVVTFEPDPRNFIALTMNAPEVNIVRVQAALGETRGYVGLSRQRRDGKPNSHDGVVHVSGSGTVPLMRLDDYPCDVCDLIYLDIEGFELYALRGATQLIERCRPAIAIEVNKNLEHVNATEADLDQFMQDHRYVRIAAFGSDRLYLPREGPCS